MRLGRALSRARDFKLDFDLLFLLYIPAYVPGEHTSKSFVPLLPLCHICWGITIEFLKFWAILSLLLPMEDKQWDETLSTGPRDRLTPDVLKGISSWTGRGEPEMEDTRGSFGSELSCFSLKKMLF